MKGKKGRDWEKYRCNRDIQGENTGREGFKQESVKKDWMSCDKTMACFIDERIAKYYFNKCLPNRIEIILFLATLSFARETLGRVNRVLQLKW